MTEKDFEQLKVGDVVVYKGNSPLGEDFTQGKAYKVKNNDIGLGIIGFKDNQGGILRYFRHAQAPDVFCSQEEWNAREKAEKDKDAWLAAYSSLYTGTKPIDWEQRRYEIVKAAIVGELASPVVEVIGSNPSMKDVCEWYVQFADALIDELKKSATQG